MKMNGYWKNPELTASVYTDDGFMKSLDVATRDENGYYDVRGRADDSYVAHDGIVVDLFELEILMYEVGSDYIMEAEAVKLSIEGSSSCIPVIHMVLQPEYIGKEAEVIVNITEICRGRLESYEMPRGFKIRTDFVTNEVSAKRDYVILKSEREHYYIADMDGTLFEITFDMDGKVKRKIVESSEIILATTK
jgi:acyl-coenzyme A synthetase/AMP-(fatty) acid ligase